MKVIWSKLASSVSTAIAAGQLHESERARNDFRSQSTATDHGACKVAVAVTVATIGLLLCAMFVFLAWLCAHGNRHHKPHASEAKNVVAEKPQSKDPAAMLDEKIRQAERDARRGDTFGDSDDDGDGDGDGDGGEGP